MAYRIIFLVSTYWCAGVRAVELAAIQLDGFGGNLSNERQLWEPAADSGQAPQFWLGGVADRELPLSAFRRGFREQEICEQGIGLRYAGEALSTSILGLYHMSGPLPWETRRPFLALLECR
jgi:hypothetical protein